MKNLFRSFFVFFFLIVSFNIYLEPIMCWSQYQVLKMPRLRWDHPWL